MKMLCIRGRQHPAHTGLVAGQVYEVYPADCCACCYPVVHAEGVKFRRPVMMRCLKCNRRLGRDIHPRWSPSRFIPWNPDELNVTEKEANDLYLIEELVK